MTPRELAIDLINAVLAGKISVEKFCSEFETHYNFNWPECHRGVDFEIFDALFDVVTYFTPYPEEKATVHPGYHAEPEVLEAVAKTLAALKAQPCNQPGRADALGLF